jgi:integrase
MPREHQSTVTRRNSHLRIPATRRALVDHPTALSSASISVLPEELRGHKVFSPALAQYVRDRFARASSGTKKQALKAFRLLWAFIGHEQINTRRMYRSWSDVDDGLLSRLIAWMSSVEDGPKLNSLTKATRYNLIRVFFEWLKIDRNVLPESWVIRRNPWPLSYRQTKSRDVLSEAELGPILRAAVQDIQNTVARWDHARAIIDDPSIVVPRPGAKISAYKSPAVALKALGTGFPEGLPSREDLKTRRKGLYHAFLHYPQFSYVSAIESLFPTPRLLVPFVVLIAQATLFNPDTVLQLRWSNIDEEHPVFGADRWRLRGDKPRAGRAQVRSFPAKVTDLTNPVALLRVLRTQTASIRTGLPRELRDYVFIFRAESSAKPAGTFVASGPSRGTWHRVLRRFIAEYRLAPFTLANLRPTGSDLVDEITEGNLTAQQTLLNHVRLETTERHYRSHAARARLQEKLAQAMAWRERYARSGGAVETRGQLGSHRAATPGYECFDPYDSPEPGQVAGRLCTGYGRCPGCPLHALNTRSPISLGRVAQLAARLDEASSVMAPSRWVSQWMPIQKAVHKHLHLFAEEVFTAARRLQLPSIPEIE